MVHDIGWPFAFYMVVYLAYLVDYDKVSNYKCDFLQIIFHHFAKNILIPTLKQIFRNAFSDASFDAFASHLRCFWLAIKCLMFLIKIGFGIRKYWQTAMEMKWSPEQTKKDLNSISLRKRLKKGNFLKIKKVFIPISPLSMGFFSKFAKKIRICGFDVFSFQIWWFLKSLRWHYWMHHGLKW